MKVLKTFIGLFFILFIFTGCNKTYQETLPTVSMVSAGLYQNGWDSILVNGNITFKGIKADNIQYEGFCYSTSPNFDITSRQVLINNVTNGAFSAKIRAFPDSTYYIKAFAANSFGYGISSVFKYTVPFPAPDTAPCSLTNNVFNEGGFPYTIAYKSYGPGSSYTGFGAWGLQASDVSSTNALNISFNVTPNNGIYTTTDQVTFTSNNNPQQVYISVVSGFYTYYVNAGASVYVAVVGSNTVISFCNATFIVGSSPVSLSAKITLP